MNYQQAVAHYEFLRNNASAQADDQIRMAQENAALQAQQDAQRAQQQQAQQLQAAQLQAQQNALQAGYGQQAQVLGANLQGQRDVLGHNIQLEQMGYGANLQAQQAQQNSQLRQQEAEHSTNLQAQLSQVQLNQQDLAQMQRLERASTHTDQQVQAGYLSPEEGAALKHQIMTGLNPLQNRHLEAQRIQTQIQTAATYQHADQQAQLFNRQQAIRSMNPQDRIREFTDANGNRATFQLGADGDWSPLDFNAAQRAERGMNVQEARATSDIGVAQTMLQPNVRHVEQSTATMAGQERRADVTAPLTNAQTIATTNAIINGDKRATDLAPAQLHQVQAHIDVLTQQADSIYQQNLAAGRAESDVDKARRLHLQQLSNTIQQQQNFNARTTPRISEDGNYVEIQPGHWAPNGSPLARAHINQLNANTAVLNREAAAQLPAADRNHLNTELGRIESTVDREVRDAPNGQPSWVGTSEQYRQAMGAPQIAWYQTEGAEEKQQRFDYYRRERITGLGNEIYRRYLGNAPAPQGNAAPRPNAGANQPAPNAAPGNPAPQGNVAGIAQQAQAQATGGVNFFDPQTPEHQQIVRSIAEIAQQVQAIGPGEEQRRAGEDLNALIRMTAQYGNTASMPANVLSEYTAIRSRLRAIPTVETSRRGQMTPEARQAAEARDLERLTPAQRRQLNEASQPLWMRLLNNVSGGR